MTRSPKTAPAHRSPDEIRVYNDSVWDMVLYKVNPVAIFVVLQIILFTRFTGHPVLQGLGFLVFGVQFVGAWALLQGTLLREMGYVSFTPLILVLWSVIGLAGTFAFGDPLALDEGPLRVAILIFLAPILIVWALTLVRWRKLKKVHAEELE